MPRPNPGRLAVEEDRLARRIAYERERREMTYEGLALRMTQAGCPTNASALYKIEKQQPRRRITVSELVALGSVFGVEIADLLTPPEILISGLGRELFSEWRALNEQAVVIAKKREEVIERMRSNSELWPGLEELLTDYSEEQGFPKLITWAQWLRNDFGPTPEERKFNAWFEEKYGMADEDMAEIAWGQNDDLHREYEAETDFQFESPAKWDGE